MPDDLSADGVAPVTPDASAAPSPAVSPAPEGGTPETPAPAPKPEFHLPPEERWNQLRQERQEAMARAERAEAMARVALERMAPQPAPSAQPDPWEGKVNHPDPQTALFYQDQRRLFQIEAERAADLKLRGVVEAMDAGRKELALLKTQQFRDKNPDIIKDSPEEQAIVSLMNQGYDLDIARKTVLFDRYEAELKALKAKSALVPQKQAANATAPTAGMPATSGLPGQPGDWRHGVREAFRKGGSLADIVNAAGASRAPAPPT